MLSDSEDHLLPRCGFCTLRVIEPYIECMQCESVDLCCECFARGAEFGSHESHHDYAVRRNDTPIYEDSDWSAADEYSLLSAISRCGYGNWTDVAKAVRSYTDLQCKQHYDRFYVDDTRCEGLPEMRSWSVLRSDPPFLYKNHPTDDPPRNIQGDVCRGMAGYNALRSDFEADYDQHAELLLNFDNGDDDDDNDQLMQSLQCAVVRAYNNRLRERHRRYAVIRRHGLINFRKFSQWWGHYEDKLGKSMCDALVVFLQLLTGVQFDALIESLAHERETRLRLYRLCELRRNGVTTFKGGRLYETLKLRREVHVREIRASQNRHPDWKLLAECDGNVAPQSALAAESQPFKLANGKKKTAPPLQIIGMEDYEKLNDDEKEFCSVIRIPPACFIRSCNLLIAENERNGFLRLCDARRLIKIDVNKTRKLFDMLVSKGAIKKPS